MNKYIKYALVIILLKGLSGCDFLEYDESSFNTRNDVFAEFDRSKRFLTGIYSYLPDDFVSVGGAMRSAATDEAVHVWDLSSVHRMNNGSWSAIQPLDDVWGTMYQGIRAANLFLLESEGRDFEELKYNLDYKELMEQFNMYPYEARFLRAFFYFELIKRYKNVPLITEVLTTEQAKNVKQSTFHEVVDFIVQECDLIAPVLPKDHANFSSAKETGRATRGAALALKARTLLYAASPLHNPGNDPELWELAARAAKEVIDLNQYTLLGNYAQNFNNNASAELIFGRRQGASNDFERRNFPIGFEGGNTGTCPTQNLVDAFEMAATGLPISDPASGYNPANPYAGRDPRLGHTILFNDATWKGRRIESFFGGIDAPPIANATKTGYYLKKHLVEAVNLAPGNTTTREHTWVLFRYSEILLNYAEAMNEAFGPENDGGLGMNALNAVNMVRARVNMPGFPAGLSKDAFRERLRNERRVELAFEDHRFWDIRRWMIGQQTTDIYAMIIGPNPFGGFAYERKLLERRIFQDHMNLYPIPQAEIYKNSKLQQNPGW